MICVSKDGLPPGSRGEGQGRTQPANWRVGAAGHTQNQGRMSLEFSVKTRATWLTPDGHPQGSPEAVAQGCPCGHRPKNNVRYFVDVPCVPQEWRNEEHLA